MTNAEREVVEGVIRVRDEVTELRAENKVLREQNERLWAMLEKRAALAAPAEPQGPSSIPQPHPEIDDVLGVGDHRKKFLEEYPDLDSSCGE